MQGSLQSSIVPPLLKEGPITGIPYLPLPMPNNDFDEDDRFKVQRRRLRDSIKYSAPYCQGTLALPQSAFTLFYGKEGNTGRLNLASTTPVQLQHLAEACQPATFGVDQQDVLDETYRKAGKLDSDDFAMKFDAVRSGLVDVVHTELVIDRLAKDKAIQAELYKLNVYEPGSFFKAHVDTPRNEFQYGSLVIVFPVDHEGGMLMIRDQHGPGGQTREWAFDSASLLSQCTQPSIAYVAFYSDIEHEVMPVLSGYRVTVTYNLYWYPPNDVPRSLPTPQPIPMVEYSFKETLQELLADHRFLPDGGNLLFGLVHKYPLETNVDDSEIGRKALQDVHTRLKSTDAVIFKVVQDCSLDAQLKVIYEVQSPNFSYAKTLVMCDRVLPLEDEWRVQEPVWESLVQEGGQLVTGPYAYRRRRYRASEVDIMDAEWITGSSEFNIFKTNFLAYGNEASMRFVYWKLWLLVRVGHIDRRSTLNVQDQSQTVRPPSIGFGSETHSSDSD